MIRSLQRRIQAETKLFPPLSRAKVLVYVDDPELGFHFVKVRP